MAKDPAINWYFDNWSGGTKLMSRHLKGCYMDLLEAQFYCGPLSLEEIKNVLGSDQASWTVLAKKFTVDEAGKYFNERLETEKNKRAEYSKKQSERVKKRWDSYHGTYHGINNGINRGNTIIETGTETSSLGKSENLFFFALTEIELKTSIEYLHRVCQKLYSPGEILNFWEGFKLQYFNEFYISRGKVIQHFRDWLKRDLHKKNQGKKQEETFKRTPL